MSKKNTCLISASSGSSPSALITERCASSGSVSFSSTLSESLASAINETSCSSFRRVGGLLFVATLAPLSVVTIS